VFSFFLFHLTGFQKFLAERLNGKASIEQYNKMIKYSGFVHKIELAERLFDDLLQNGVKPNAETYLKVNE